MRSDKRFAAKTKTNIKTKEEKSDHHTMGSLAILVGSHELGMLPMEYALGAG